MRQTASRILAIAALAAAGCAAEPKPSDTGFTGTWARSAPVSGFRSTVSILRDGDRHLFRWKLDSEDGKWKVQCDWDGRCDEWVEGRKVANYLFAVRPGKSNNELVVECTRTPLVEGIQGFHYVDDLVLEPGGLQLTAYTREAGGEQYPRELASVKRLEKRSNDVDDPPKPRSS